MTKFIPIGKVQGEDGKIAQVNTVYVNDGGDPDVLADISGESTNATLTLTFKNLVRDQLTESELDQIISNITVTSSNVVTGTRLSKFWEKLWAKLNETFAKTKHNHGTNDIDNDAITTNKIDDKAITKAKIADGAVGKDQLDTELGNSIFQVVTKHIDEVTIGADGYAEIWQTNQDKVVASTIRYFGNITPAGTIAASSRWLIGSPGQRVTNLDMVFLVQN